MAPCISFISRTGTSDRRSRRQSRMHILCFLYCSTYFWDEKRLPEAKGAASLRLLWVLLSFFSCFEGPRHLFVSFWTWLSSATECGGRGSFPQPTQSECCAERTRLVNKKMENGTQSAGGWGIQCPGRKRCRHAVWAGWIKLAQECVWELIKREEIHGRRRAIQ